VISTVNTAPTISPISTIIGVKGEAVNMQIINSQTGVISGYHVSSGVPLVKVSVNDGRGGTDDQIFYWSVALAKPYCPDCLSFYNRNGRVSFVGYANQDIDIGTPISFTDKYKGLHLEGNRWVIFNSHFNIYPDSQLTFDFKSSAEGQIHGIGFDGDNNLSAERVINIYGTQPEVGISDAERYDGSGEYQSFTIPIGEYYQGENLKIFFANDEDQLSNGNESYFKNIRVFRAKLILAF